MGAQVNNVAMFHVDTDTSIGRLRRNSVQ